MVAAPLRVTAVSKAFGGVLAVDQVSFDLEAGKVNSIIGPNGAGKTTLLNLLTGVYAPSAGNVVFDGADVTGLAPHQLAARGMGGTFQNLQVFFNMSALENVMVGRHLRERAGWLAALLRSPRLAAGGRESRGGGAGRGPHPDRSAGHQRADRAPRAVRRDGGAGRAQHAPGDGRLGPYRGARLRPQALRRHRRTGAQRSQSHRGLSGKRGARVMLEVSALISHYGGIQ